MKSFLLITTVFLFSAHSIFASGVGVEVLWLKGQVSYQDQNLTKGMTIPLGHTIETAKKSFIKLKIPKVGEVSGVVVTLGPDSSMLLADNPTKEKSHQFIKGAARFLHEKVIGKPVEIHTAQASIGVRGTEYLLKVNPALGESEIVLFEGKVEMTNLVDKENSIEINPGQWGGLGGRFGPKLGDPITLPEKVYSGFKKLLKI